MKKILLFIPAIFVIRAFADDVQINAEIVEPVQAISIMVTPEDHHIESTDKLNVSSDKIFDMFNHAQGVIQNTVETIDEASETVGDIAECINDMCDDYLDANSDENKPIQIPGQKEKLQILFESVVTGLQQQGLNDDQISEIFEAIKMMKKHGFTAQQIELFIKGLILEAANHSVVTHEINSYCKKILFNPASVGTICMIIGILGSIFYFTKYAASAPAKV
ncbi:MAG: hypothetical protein US49_C0003G0038 [candidate division TM6 bacterium GW2011_GWF2_37_49]|nr:MAG: hypothetical protein US49_C0003G0038 [candidate division TM6 bacterium GW2011_GWF2_37_49]